MKSIFFLVVWVYLLIAVYGTSTCLFCTPTAFIVDRENTTRGLQKSTSENQIISTPHHLLLRSHSTPAAPGLHDQRMDDAPIRVGIAGAGAIAFGTAAILSQGGHDPMLWSPSGSSSRELLLEPDDSRYSAYGNGAEEPPKAQRIVAEMNGSGTDDAKDWTFVPRLATTAKELVEENDVVLIAVPANGHKRVFDEIAPFLVTGRHEVIISSHASLGALYLSQLLRDRLGDNDHQALMIPITAWGTTVCTARRPSGTRVRVNTIRKSVDLCTVPSQQSQSSLSLCRKLFPAVESFRPRDGLLAISLSNLNPQNHLGIALGNISRMEKGENWYQSLHITPTIGRLLESLDQERLAIAEALHLETKTIFEHFSLSFHVPLTDSISDMNQEIYRAGNDVYGPNTADSRYILEDIPFGLIPTLVLGDLVGRPARLHQSGVHLVSAMYGCDFYAQNDLLSALRLEQYTLEALQEAAQTGVLVQKKQKAMHPSSLPQ